jgi:hypothetical protein
MRRGSFGRISAGAASRHRLIGRTLRVERRSLRQSDRQEVLRHLPDAIGHGKSSKPSDELRASFAPYNYDDIISAQYRLVMEHLGVRELRLV